MDAVMGPSEMLKAALSMPWALQELAFYLPGLRAKLIGHVHIHCNVHRLHMYNKLVQYPDLYGICENRLKLLLSFEHSSYKRFVV